MNQWTWTDASQTVAMIDLGNGVTRSVSRADPELADFLAKGGQPVADLAATIAARRADIDALYLAKLGAGAAFGGKRVQIDPASQLNIAGAAAQASILGASFPGIRWRMADNSFLALPDAAAVIGLAQAAAAQAEALRIVMWGHKDALAALGDAASVLAYDVTKGW